jgi:hypothetical protein
MDNEKDPVRRLIARATLNATYRESSEVLPGHLLAAAVTEAVSEKASVREVLHDIEGRVDGRYGGPRTYDPAMRPSAIFSRAAFRILKRGFARTAEPKTSVDALRVVLSGFDAGWRTHRQLRALHITVKQLRVASALLVADGTHAR